MKIVRKKERKVFKNSENCIAFEYELIDKDLSGTVVEVNGRYPAKGLALNSECKELAYIMDGGGRILVEGNEFEFTAGDLILINAGEKYFWNGKFAAFLASNPAWNLEQYKNFE